MPAVISSSLNSTAANHQAQVNKKTHTAEQGPRCSFQYRIRKYKRLRPLQSGADRREHVTCGKTRLPMLFSRRYRIVRIQEITPFTRRHDGREHVAYNRARHIVLYTKNTIGDMKAEFSKSPHLYRSQHRRKPNKAKQSQTKTRIGRFPKKTSRFVSIGI